MTTSNPDAALNFGLDEHVDHAERYERGREFFDVVTGLWDSWADDAFIRDVETGIFFDPAKLHVLDHKGDSFVGTRSIEHRAAGAGVARDRAGGVVGGGKADCGRDRRSRVHRAAHTR